MRDRNQNKQAAKEAQKESSSVPSETEKEKQEEEQKPTEPTDFSKRTKYTLIMLGGFMLIIAMGHFYITLLILGLAAACYKEAITALRAQKQKALEKFDYNNFLAWYQFVVFIFFVLTKTFSSITGYEVQIEIYLKPEFTAFILWVIGFVIFVLTLKNHNYKYQFKLFAVNVMSLIFTTSQILLIIYNLYYGMIWFGLQTLLVISNDIFAYIFGKTFGRHPLIALSPKKTWEGFIGGFFCTLVVGYLFAFVLSLFPQDSSFYQFLVCPQEEVNFAPFRFTNCKPIETFRMRNMEIPIWSSVFGPVFCSEFHVHAFVLSLFASLIAPFGGFFASGLKRGLKIKDFSSTIPGHGGFLDRFDCQMIMGSFTFFYIRHIVKGGTNSIGSVLIYLFTLALEDQKYIMEKIKENLIRKGVILN